jgi:hypothetical protein
MDMDAETVRFDFVLETNIERLGIVSYDYGGWKS